MKKERLIEKKQAVFHAVEINLPKPSALLTQTAQIHRLVLVRRKVGINTVCRMERKGVRPHRTLFHGFLCQHRFAKMQSLTAPFFMYSAKRT